MYGDRVSELETLARRLRDEPGFSRNRRFDELSSPEARHLRSRLRRLAGIARELSVAHSVELLPDRGGYRLRLAFPALRARRETFLTADEHALLSRDGLLPAQHPAPLDDAG
jgi:hypothetical protein